MIFTALATAVLATTALAKGSVECNFSEPTGAQQCFGAVGQLLIFHLSNTANTNIRLNKDGKLVILKIANNQIQSAHDQYVNPSEPLTNGTITLGIAMKNHSGDYLLEEFGSNGVLLNTVNMHLEIQAPVSKPAVSQMCVPPEQRNISCSSEGDGVEFIFTLDNLLLMRTKDHSQSPSSATARQDKPSVSNVTLSLHGQLTGNLMCHVWNNVSRDETVIHLISCKDAVSSSPVTVAVTASVVTLLLVALCLGIIKLHNKPRSTTINEGNAEDEVVYTDVRIIKNTRRTGLDSHQNAT